MYISPWIALSIDTFATLLAQTGYTIQKKGHMSVEAHNALSPNPKERKNGFYTKTWIAGFALACFAGAMHAGKCFNKQIALLFLLKASVEIF